MQESDLSDLVSGTADVAFGVMLDGTIRCWNEAATEFFGVPSVAAIGLPCAGHICHFGDVQSGCVVLQRALDHHTVPAFDVQWETARGNRWVNVSIIVVRVRHDVCAVHLARNIEQRRRIEELARTFLNHVSVLTGLDTEQLLSVPAQPHTDLTAQERKVLRLLVDGKGTRDISALLNVSAATVRNHIEHILQKLSSHSRVEAVLRAIREKLV